MKNNLIIGRNPVTEAIKSGRTIDKIVMQKGASGSAGKILSLAKENRITVEFAEKNVLDKLAGSGAHQGVCAFASSYEYAELKDIMSKAQELGEEPLIVILDDIEDPHNLGAIMRTAECAGASGVIIPKRGASGLTETVAKTSAGAIEYMPCMRVTNIARTIDELKTLGFWIAVCDMDGSLHTKTDLTGKLAIVIGSEGKGVGRLVKEKCDFTVSVPMRGKINSLNASNAAAVVLYEIRRQRDIKAK